MNNQINQQMSKRVVKYFIPWGGSHGYKGFLNAALSNNIFEETRDIEEANLLVLTGGEDVSPEIYDEVKHPKTYANIPRDVEEFASVRYAVEKNIPILGVCRGAQLLCVAAGGKLVQHTIKHSGGGNHIIESNWGPLEVNSIHHQMMFPWDLPMSDYDILAWTTGVDSVIYEGGDAKNITSDIPYIIHSGQPKVKAQPEVIHFKKIKALGIQYHPEMMETNDLAVHYSATLVNDLLEYYEEESI